MEKEYAVTRMTTFLQLSEVCAGLRDLFCVSAEVVCEKALISAAGHAFFRLREDLERVIRVRQRLAGDLGRINISAGTHTPCKPLAGPARPAQQKALYFQRSARAEVLRMKTSSQATLEGSRMFFSRRYDSLISFLLSKFVLGQLFKVKQHLVATSYGLCFEYIHIYLLDTSTYLVWFDRLVQSNH